MASLTYQPKGSLEFRCRLESDKGYVLSLDGSLESAVPVIEGDRELADNPTLVAYVWGFGRFEKDRRRLRNPNRRARSAKEAEDHRRKALRLARLEGDVTSERVSGRWCSGCFNRTDHRKVRPSISAPYLCLCANCGIPTVPCAVVGCRNFANAASGPAAAPRHCAEHRHEIPAFDKLESRLADIGEYKDWLRFEKTDVTKVNKIVVATFVGAAVLVPLTLAAAPAIGGVIGAYGTGLTGAAATSHGLAMIGGGTIAAGGAGVAGGTTVVTAVGGALGTAMGASVSTAYVSADKSFAIVLLRRGTGTPVLIANGFLTEGDEGWGGFRRMIDERYPDAPVYRVHWGAKELKAFGSLGTAVGKGVGAGIVKVAAMSANKIAARVIPGIGGAMVGVDLARNPWHVANNRAAMTGAALAGIIARTETPEFALVGHSLGGRVMATAAQALATVPDAPRVESLHLLGAAFSGGRDWDLLSQGVSGSVWNYFSRNDAVLRNLYTVASGGRRAVGAVGLRSKDPKIKDRDVSKRVASHSAYFDQVSLAR